MVNAFEKSRDVRTEKYPLDLAIGQSSQALLFGSDSKMEVSWEVGEGQRKRRHEDIQNTEGVWL